MADKKLVIHSVWCKGCGICAAFCPKKILAISHGKVVVSDAGQCIHCELCEMRCPDYAIYIEKEGSEKEVAGA